MNQLIDIVDLVSQYVDLQPKGNRYTGKCPFHDDKNASMVIYPETQTFHCFGCKAGRISVTGGAGAIDFYAAFHHVSYEEAYERLRVEYGLPEQNSSVLKAYKMLEQRSQLYHNNLLQNKRLLEYLNNRGIPIFDVRKWQLGCDDNKIVYPITNQFNKICGFGYRRDPFIENPEEDKYKNTYDNALFKKKELLYGLYSALITAEQYERDYIVAVEGYNDVIVMQKYNIPATAIMNAYLTKEHLQILKHIDKPLIVMLDGDSAGERGALETVKMCREESILVKIVQLASGDPDDLANTYKQATNEYILQHAEFPLIQLIKRELLEYMIKAVTGEQDLLRKLNDITVGVSNRYEKEAYQKLVQGVLKWT